MPAYTRWRRFTLENVKSIPHKRGKYELASQNKSIIYHGGSESSVRDRLMSHLRANKFPTAKFFRCTYAGLLESGIDMEASASKKFQKTHKKKSKYTKRSPKTSFLGKLFRLK